MRAVESLQGLGIAMAEKVKLKTIREMREFYKSYPRGRRIAGYVATLAWLLFIIGIYLAVYFRTGFISYLVLAFLCFLSTSHSNYALAQNLTQRKARQIDYWYLGIAAIGLLLFAAGYSHQRDVTIARMMVKVHENGEAPIRFEVDKSMARLSEFLCGAFVIKSKQPCEGLRKIRWEVKPNLSATAISDLQERFTNEVGVPYGLAYKVEEIVRNQNIFLPLSVVQVRMDDWRKYMADAPAQPAADIVDEEAEIMFGLGQWVIWPFLLAYALALRITKVTVDVFEWAK
jgi:hypothetical protein